MITLNTNACRFECRDLGVYTRNLRTAIVWHKNKMAVDFYYNDKYVGFLSYAGHLEHEEFLPDDGDYGTVYSSGDDDALYISYPDESDHDWKPGGKPFHNLVCVG